MAGSVLDRSRGGGLLLALAEPSIPTQEAR